MNIFEIITYLIFALMTILAIWVIYLLLSRPKEIVFSLLCGMKSSPETFAGMLRWILLLPIWGPAFLLDKKYNWEIFNVEEADESDDLEDIEYKSDARLEINLADYRKFIEFKNTSKPDIVTAFNECAACTPDLGTKMLSEIVDEKRIITEFDDKTTFFNFNFLVQWFATNLADAEVNGIAQNKINQDHSFYVVSDTTGKHINSLTGQTENGNKFSVYLLNDYSRNEWLALNQNLKLDRELDFLEVLNHIDSNFK